MAGAQDMSLRLVNNKRAVADLVDDYIRVHERIIFIPKVKMPEKDWPETTKRTEIAITINGFRVNML